MFELWIIYFENGKPSEYWSHPVSITRQIESWGRVKWKRERARYKSKALCEGSMFIDGAESLSGMYRNAEAIGPDPIVKFECRPVKGDEVG